MATSKKKPTPKAKPASKSRTSTKEPLKKPTPKAKPASKSRTSTKEPLKEPTQKVKPASKSRASTKEPKKSGTSDNVQVNDVSGWHDEAKPIAASPVGKSLIDISSSRGDGTNHPEPTIVDNVPLEILGDAADAESVDDAQRQTNKLPGAMPRLADITPNTDSDSVLSSIDDGANDPEPHSATLSEDDVNGHERNDARAPVMALAGELLEDLGDIHDTGALLRHAIEAMLFVSDKPVTIKELSKGLQLDRKRTLELLAELQREYEHRGIRIDEVADGYAFRTHSSVAEYVRSFLEQRPVRLSRAQLETLSIVAYRQPITRPEVDDIRGVNCGPVLKGLLERDLIRILGKKDEPGRPMLYGTTPSFLELFGLKSLQDLPTLREFAELSEDSKRKYEEEIGEGPPIGLADLGLEQDGNDSGGAVAPADPFNAGSLFPLRHGCSWV